MYVTCVYVRQTDIIIGMLCKEWTRSALHLDLHLVHIGLEFFLMCMIIIIRKTRVNCLAIAASLGLKVFRSCFLARHIFIFKRMIWCRQNNKWDFRTYSVPMSTWLILTQQGKIFYRCRIWISIPAWYHKLSSLENV